jgi:hypothetical protein
MLYSQEKKPQCTFDRKLREPQNQSRHGGEEKKIPSLFLPSIEPRGGINNRIEKIT